MKKKKNKSKELQLIKDKAYLEQENDAYKLCGDLLSDKKVEVESFRENKVKGNI